MSYQKLFQDVLHVLRLAQFQKQAPFKGTVPNGRHRLRDSDASQRTAPCKGTFSNGRSRLRDSDTYQRSAPCKGTVQDAATVEGAETSSLLFTSHQDMWGWNHIFSWHLSKSQVWKIYLQTTCWVVISESKAAICR